jgi:hypothetical protein
MGLPKVNWINHSLPQRDLRCSCFIVTGGTTSHRIPLGRISREYVKMLRTNLDAHGMWLLATSKVTCLVLQVRRDVVRGSRCIMYVYSLNGIRE